MNGVKTGSAGCLPSELRIVRCDPWTGRRTCRGQISSRRFALRLRPRIPRASIQSLISRKWWHRPVLLFGTGRVLYFPWRTRGLHRRRQNLGRQVSGRQGFGRDGFGEYSDACRARPASPSAHPPGHHRAVRDPVLHRLSMPRGRKGSASVAFLRLQERQLPSTCRRTSTGGRTR